MERPFVGRDRELAWLDDEVGRASKGELRMVLLTGDPGIGKSRLAAELLGRLAPDIVRLHARARPIAADVSFGLWAEAIDGYLRSLPVNGVRGICGPLLDELAVLVPSVDGDRDARRGAPRPVPDLRHTVARFVERLAQALTVVLTFDDVHWADAASLEALHTLGRTATPVRALVLLTARPVELARSAAVDVLAAAEQDGMLRRRTLPPLAPADVANLASATLGWSAPEALAGWLQRRAEGNPLFALSLLDALMESGSDLEAPCLDGIPDAVRLHVALRLQGLEPEAVQLLEVLAVEGGHARPAELARVADLTPDAVAVALERLVEARLVGEVEQGPRLAYEVAHPLVRDAVYERIGGARRRLLHRAVARALAAGGRLQSAAPHFALAADEGDDEAVDALCQAVRHAEERGLHRDALAALRALLDVLPRGDPRWLDVLEAMPAEAEWVVAHLAEVHSETGLAVMQRIDPLLEEMGDRGRRAVVQLRMASFLGLGLGRLQAAERAARQARELFEQAGQRHEALLALNELGYIKAGGEGLESQAAIAFEVLALAASAHDRTARLQALCSLGSATLSLGRFEEAESALASAIEAARAEPNTYRVAWLQALSSLAFGFQGRMVEALAVSEEALASRWAGDAVAYECRSILDWLRGDLAGIAASVSEASVRHGGRLGRRRAWAVELAARASIESGDFDGAERLLGNAVRAYGERPFYVWGPSCDWVRGVLSFERRRPAQALELVRDACHRYAEIGFATYEAMALVDLARMAASCGDQATATGAAQRLAALAPSDFVRTMSLLASAWVGVAGGGGSGAAEVGDAATEACERLGLRLYAAVAREAAGRALLGHDLPGAVSRLQTAADGMAASGAWWREQQVRRVLRRIGSRGRRAAASGQGPTALTPREREIAGLAASGYTSREIGRELFIGQRTVETHLANVCAKLGVATKRELVARREELGL